MPQDLKCDPNTGDLVVATDGDIEELDDTQSALQDLRVRLRMIRQESLLTPGAGMDLDELSAGLPLDLVAGMIRTEAEQVAGMSQVLVEPTVDQIPADRIVPFRLRATLSLSDRIEDLKIIDEVIQLEIPG